ncbi:hypothetical protein EVAR_49009_1 [Eumeta japonica]|uniref:Uncharacterized protein n=1 Tax=Eumeta variegata TaxID=151549 RepID=A0A4C1XSP7_EUMVA|nr:hypothetical protein EVAR_49009_1 [Eumeta japonica]
MGSRGRRTEELGASNLRIESFADNSQLQNFVRFTSPRRNRKLAVPEHRRDSGRSADPSTANPIQTSVAEDLKQLSSTISIILVCLATQSRTGREKIVFPLREGWEGGENPYGPSMPEHTGVSDLHRLKPPEQRKSAMARAERYYAFI